MRAIRFPRTDTTMAQNVDAASFVRHLADRLRGPLERVGADVAGRLETLAEPGHDHDRRRFATGHARPRRAPAMWNLIEFVPAAR